MPTYYAAGVSARLSVASLSTSTTSAPSLRSGPGAKANLVAAEVALASAQRLREVDIECLDDGTGVHFLGCRGEAPFLCAGIDLQGQPSLSSVGSATGPMRKSRVEQLQKQNSGLAEDQGTSHSNAISGLSSLSITPLQPPKEWTDANAVKQTPAKHTTSSQGAPSIPDEDEGAKALMLTVKLEEKAFDRSKLGTNQQDIRIEVFLNGQLTHCSLVRWQPKSDKSEMVFQFTGRRISRVLEQAWILKAPLDMRQDSMGPQDRDITRDDAALHTKRWQEIGAGLRSVASSSGADPQGNKSPTSGYLQTLADMRMPSVLSKPQTQAGPAFAVLDVVMALGDGKKFPTNRGYLLAPERLQDTRFSNRTSGAALAGNTSNATSLPLPTTSTLPWASNKPSYPPIGVAPALSGLTWDNSLSKRIDLGITSASSRISTVGSAGLIGFNPSALHETNHSGVPGMMQHSDSKRRAPACITSKGDGSTSHVLSPPPIGSSPPGDPDSRSVGAMATRSSDNKMTSQTSRARSWSYRSQDGAKTAFRGPTQPIVSIAMRRRDSVVVVIPYKPSDLSNVGDSGTMPSMQSDDSRGPSTKASIPRASSEITSSDVELSAKRQTIALKEGAKLSGPLMTAISRDVSSGFSIHQHFPAVPADAEPRQPNKSRRHELTPLQRTARRPSTETDREALGNPSIAIAEGVAAKHVMKAHSFQTPAQYTGPGIMSTVVVAAPTLSNASLDEGTPQADGSEGGDGVGSRVVTKADGTGKVRRGQATKKRKRSLGINLAPGPAKQTSPAAALPPSQELITKVRPLVSLSAQPFHMPDLCKDSVVTYGHTEDTEGAKAVRQVKAERGGDFRETEVLVGVRFLIGNGFSVQP